jgi:hypothetical protein
MMLAAFGLELLDTPLQGGQEAFTELSEIMPQAAYARSDTAAPGAPSPLILSRCWALLL